MFLFSLCCDGGIALFGCVVSCLVCLLLRSLQLVGLVFTLLLASFLMVVGYLLICGLLGAWLFILCCCLYLINVSCCDLFMVYLMLRNVCMIGCCLIGGCCDFTFDCLLCWFVLCLLLCCSLGLCLYASGVAVCWWFAIALYV